MTKSKASYHIVWRPIAVADLNDIIDYIAQDSPLKAEAFGQALRDKVRLLAQYPRLGRVGRPGLPDFLHELVAHRHYIIFYRVLDAIHTVEILRVKHTAQQKP